MKYVYFVSCILLIAIEGKGASADDPCAKMKLTEIRFKDCSKAENNGCFVTIDLGNQPPKVISDLGNRPTKTISGFEPFNSYDNDGLGFSSKCKGQALTGNPVNLPAECVVAIRFAQPKAGAAILRCVFEGSKGKSVNDNKKIGPLVNPKEQGAETS